MILILLLYALCASTFTISKSALLYTQPLFFIAVRMIGAGCMLGIYYAARVFLGKELFVFKWRDSFLFAQIILFHIYITYICDICALKNLTSIESAFIYNLSPFIAALLSYWYFAEKITAKKWLGLTIGFCAFIPELYFHGLAMSSSIAPKLITLIAVISSAYGWIIMRQLVKDRHYSPLFINGVGMLGGGIGALITSWIFEGYYPPVTQWIPFLNYTALSIVVANIFFYNLYGVLLSRYTATFLSFAGFLCPLFTALFGWFFLGEWPSLSLCISSVIAAIGLFIFHQEELRQGYGAHQ